LVKKAKQRDAFWDRVRNKFRTNHLMSQGSTGKKAKTVVDHKTKHMREGKNPMARENGKKNPLVSAGKKTPPKANDANNRGNHLCLTKGNLKARGKAHVVSSRGSATQPWPNKDGLYSRNRKEYPRSRVKNLGR